MNSTSFSARAASDYVDAAVAWLQRQDLMRFPGPVPEAMLDPTIQPMDDWVGWKPVSSTVSDSDLDEIEGRAGAAFPPVYREFLKYKHFIMLTELGVRFERHLCTDWKQALLSVMFNQWKPERMVGIGLLPFGCETFMDAGPVCFDTRARLPDGDCPVVFWDHEWVRTEKEVQPLFSSARRMFECLIVVANSDAAPTAAVVRRFFEIDPAGAGGPARPYWSSWS